MIGYGNAKGSGGKDDAGRWSKGSRKNLPDPFEYRKVSKNYSKEEREESINI